MNQETDGEATDEAPLVVDLDDAAVAEIIEWDIRNWSRVLPFWASNLAPVDGLTEALTLGERHGGLSLWCAAGGMKVVATDIGGVTEQGRALHRRHGVDHAIEHSCADATRLPFADESFDLVLFKSMLGALETRERQAQAVAEMHRVLRPGGQLLFAENLQASALHQRIRARFVPWSARWRYLHPSEDLSLFDDFDHLTLERHGLLATFGRSEGQRDLLGRLDAVLAPRVPDRWNYILFGVAHKGETTSAARA